MSVVERFIRIVGYSGIRAVEGGFDFIGYFEIRFYLVR